MKSEFYDIQIDICLKNFADSFLKKNMKSNLIAGGFSQHHPDSVVAVSNAKGTKLKSQLMHHCKRNSVNVSLQDDDDIMEVEDHQRAMMDKLNGNPAAAVFVSSISNSSQPICPLLETQM